jgi:hypothetical protein
MSFQHRRPLSFQLRDLPGALPSSAPALCSCDAQIEADNEIRTRFAITRDQWSRYDEADRAWWRYKHTATAVLGDEPPKDPELYVLRHDIEKHLPARRLDYTPIYGFGRSGIACHEWDKALEPVLTEADVRRRLQAQRGWEMSHPTPLSEKVGFQSFVFALGVLAGVSGLGAIYLLWGLASFFTAAMVGLALGGGLLMLTLL